MEFNFKKNHVEMICVRKGKEYKVLISHESFDKVRDHPYSWGIWLNHTNKAYYCVSTVYDGVKDGHHKYYTLRLNRFVVDAKEGDYVDHINHDTLDNRLENLRIVDNSDNMKNRSGINSNNKSGYRNVYWSKSDKKWHVQLQVDGKRTILGRFDDVHEAGKYAKEMRRKYYKIKPKKPDVNNK